MKSLVIFACFIAISTAHSGLFDIFRQGPKAPRIDLSAEYQAQLDKYVEELKQRDPTHVDYITVLDLWGMSVRAYNVDMIGFSNVKTHVNATRDDWIAKFELEVIMVDTTENVESFDMSLVTIYGQGSASLRLKNVRIFMSIKKHRNEGFLPSVVETSIESANVAITGVFNNPEFSQILSEAATNFFYYVFNNPAYARAIEAMIDKELEGYNMY